jgi:hypothetical protein
MEPVLGALAAVTGPQPEDLPPALDCDGQGHIHGPVGDRPMYVGRSATAPSRIFTWMA